MHIVSLIRPYQRLAYNHMENQGKMRLSYDPWYQNYAFLAHKVGRTKRFSLEKIYNNDKIILTYST